MEIVREGEGKEKPARMKDDFVHVSVGYLDFSLGRQIDDCWVALNQAGLSTVANSERRRVDEST